MTTRRKFCIICQAPKSPKHMTLCLFCKKKEDLSRTIFRHQIPNAPVNRIELFKNGDCSPLQCQVPPITINLLGFLVGMKNPEIKLETE